MSDQVKQKVLLPWTPRATTIEDNLNKYAKEGWRLQDIFTTSRKVNGNYVFQPNLILLTRDETQFQYRCLIIRIEKEEQIQTEVDKLNAEGFQLKCAHPITTVPVGNEGMGGSVARTLMLFESE